MSNTFRLADPDPRLSAERDRILASLRSALPPEVEVFEVGSTAVAGVIGKGDLDVLVRVDADRFVAVRAQLDRLLRRNPDQLSTEIYQGYLVPSPLDVAVQLTVAGGPHDTFLVFLEALRADPGLVADYNALKRRWDGRPMGEYREAKAAFIRAVLFGQQTTSNS